MKTIELTEEELKELLEKKAGEVIFGNLEVKVKKKVEQWNPKVGEWIIDMYSEQEYAGLVRETKEQAESAAKKMRAFNRLLAYVDEFDPDYNYRKGISNYYIYYYHGSGRYEYHYSKETQTLGAVYMSKEVARELCRKLNSGEVIL